MTHVWPEDPHSTELKPGSADPYDCQSVPSLVEKLASMSDGEIYRALFCDCLTGLQNRRAFEERTYSFVAIVDMDSLKYVNDTYGHRHGDEHLIMLGNVLVDKFGYGNVYRISGDEFAVVSDSIDFGEQIYFARRSYNRFSFGLGHCIESADRFLQCDKSSRVLRRLRSPRGECPPWLK